MFVSSYLKTNPTSWTPGEKTCKSKFQMRVWRLWGLRMSYFWCVFKFIHKQTSVYGWIYVVHILAFLPSCECDIMLKMKYQHCGKKNKTSLRLLRETLQPWFCSEAAEMFCGLQNVTRLSISLRARRERLNFLLLVDLSHVPTQGWVVVD